MKLVCDEAEVRRRLRVTIRAQNEKLGAALKQNEKLRAEVKRRVDLARDLGRAQEARRKAEEKAGRLETLYARVSSNFYTLETRFESLRARLGKRHGQNHQDDSSDIESTNDSVYDPETLITKAPKVPVVPGYMISTASSRAKVVFVEKEAQRETLGSSVCSSPAEVDSWGSCNGTTSTMAWTTQTTLATTDNTATTFDGKLLEESKLLLPDNQWHGVLIRRLGTEHRITAYVDDEWLDDYAGAVILPSKFSRNILQTALDLAAEIWYTWLRKEKPDLLARWAPEGWWDLLLDRSTLISRGHGSVGHSRTDQFGSKHRRAQDILFYQIGELRNAVSHFSRKHHTKPGTLFPLLHSVLEFAKDLHDTIGANRAKELLNGLFDEAQKTYGHIERNKLLAVLPGKSPWEYHHLLLFEKVQKEIREYVDSQTLAERCKPDYWGESTLKTERYGPAVVQAAWNQSLCSQHGPHSTWPQEVHWSDKDINFNEQLRYSFNMWSRLSPTNPDAAAWTPCYSSYFRMKRRYSLCGSDYNTMARAGWPKSRWKDRRDPRVGLGWMDLALEI